MPKTTTYSDKVNEIVDLFMQLNVMELLQLQEALKAQGIEPMATPVVATEVIEAPAEAAAPTMFSVILTGHAEGKKVSVIRGIRGINNQLSLKEAKEFVEGTPWE